MAPRLRSSRERTYFARDSGGGATSRLTPGTAKMPEPDATDQPSTPSLGPLIPTYPDGKKIVYDKNRATIPAIQ